MSLCPDEFAAGDSTACSDCAAQSETSFVSCSLSRAMSICSDLVPGPSPPPSEKFVPAITIMLYTPSKSWSIAGENDNTDVKRNVADTMYNVSGQLPGRNSDNVIGTPVRPMLEDPDNFDFRPKPDSPAVGAGPYPDPATDHWKPGHQGSSERSSASTSHDEAWAYYHQIRVEVRGQAVVV